MKNVHKLVALCMLLCVFALPVKADTADPVELKAPVTTDAAAWETFSRNLVAALHSDHEGLKLGALQMVIRYGDQVDVDAAAIEMLRIYRNHDNDNVRRMAVVALGSMDRDWILGVLKRDEPFEKCTAVKKTLQAVIARA